MSSPMTINVAKLLALSSMLYSATMVHGIKMKPNQQEIVDQDESEPQKLRVASWRLITPEPVEDSESDLIARKQPDGTILYASRKAEKEKAMQTVINLRQRARQQQEQRRPASQDSEKVTKTLGTDIADSQAGGSAEQQRAGMARLMAKAEEQRAIKSKLEAEKNKAQRKLEAEKQAEEAVRRAEELAEEASSSSFNSSSSSDIEETYRDLTRKRLIPAYAVSALASNREAWGKRIYYVLTREAYIRSAMSDYSLVKGITEEKLDERKEQLCNKFDINQNLDSHQVYFQDGYCVLCQKHLNFSEQERAKHFRLWHDLGLRGEEYEKRMKARQGDEKWRKKYNRAMGIREEDKKEKEEKFLKQHEDKVKAVPPFSGAKQLGAYECFECNEQLTTSIFGLERHLKSHETNPVARIYTNKAKGVKYPHEQYFSGGVCSREPGAHFTHFIIGGVKYFRGDEWSCRHCSFKKKWEENATGQKGSRIVESIEKHLSYFESHGKCEEKEEKVNQAGAGGSGTVEV